MGRLYDSDKHGGGDPHYKVRDSDNNSARHTGDKYETTDDGHTHDSYKLDTASGSYSEYRGGDKSSDRSSTKW